MIATLAFDEVTPAALARLHEFIDSEACNIGRPINPHVVWEGLRYVKMTGSVLNRDQNTYHVTLSVALTFPAAFGFAAVDGTQNNVSGHWHASANLIAEITKIAEPASNCPLGHIAPAASDQKNFTYALDEEARVKLIREFLHKYEGKWVPANLYHGNELRLSRNNIIQDNLPHLMHFSLLLSVQGDFEDDFIRDLKVLNEKLAAIKPSS